MVEVQVKEKESFERALRRFKKMWERAGVLREIISRAFILNRVTLGYCLQST